MPSIRSLKVLKVKFVLNALASPHTARADDRSVRSRSSLRDIQILPSAIFRGTLVHAMCSPYADHAGRSICA